MVKIENTVTPSQEWWMTVIMGARNPYDSWAKSDSYIDGLADEDDKFENKLIIGPADERLLKSLAFAGDDHGKFMRMLPVICEITAPLHLWKQISTYKVGTVEDSCSTMHRIVSNPFTVDDFSWEHTDEIVQENVLQHLNLLRRQYIDEEDADKRKEIWFKVIEFLPESYNQKRTWCGNYQVLKHIYHARKGHKLKDWETIRSWIESLPYSYLITGKSVDESDA